MWISPPNGEAGPHPDTMGRVTPAKPADGPDLLVDAEIDDVPAAPRTTLPGGPGSRRALARSDAGLPGWAVVALTTVPVTLLGVFAPLAPVLGRRFG